ncbi:MAG: hypothetical protein GF344_05360 [Chitinivibrionales bacterium]|nr:hypothetical protein [Chitinivibrionales bacterium]
MKKLKALDQHEVIERGVDALYKELGPAEARRFIALTHPSRREDSVARHRRWQASLKKDDFFNTMRKEYRKAKKAAKK